MSDVKMKIAMENLEYVGNILNIVADIGEGIPVQTQIRCVLAVEKLKHIADLLKEQDTTIRALMGEYGDSCSTEGECKKN